MKVEVMNKKILYFGSVLVRLLHMGYYGPYNLDWVDFWCTIFSLQYVGDASLLS